MFLQQAFCRPFWGEGKHFGIQLIFSQWSNCHPKNWCTGNRWMRHLAEGWELKLHSTGEVGAIPPVKDQWRSPLPWILVYHGPVSKSPPHLGVAGGAIDPWSFHSVQKGGFRVDTLVDVVFWLGACLANQIRCFFLKGGGAGRAKNSQLTPPHPVLAPRLLVWNPENRAKHEDFLGRGSRDDREIWFNLSQIDYEMMPILSFVRFNLKPCTLQKWYYFSKFLHDRSSQTLQLWSWHSFKTSVSFSHYYTWMRHASQNRCIWRCSLHVSWSYVRCRWKPRCLIEGKRFDRQNLARLTVMAPRNCQWDKLYNNKPCESPPVIFYPLTRVSWGPLTGYKKSIKIMEFFQKSCGSNSSWRSVFSYQQKCLRPRWWVFNMFIFTPIPGEMIQCDWYFSNGLKPPTRINCQFFSLLWPLSG